MEFKHVTLKEIKQQGRVWEELLGSLDGKKEEISSFLDSIDAKNRKIIFVVDKKNKVVKLPWLKIKKKKKRSKISVFVKN